MPHDGSPQAAPRRRRIGGHAGAMGALGNLARARQHRRRTVRPRAARVARRSVHPVMSARELVLSYERGRWHARGDGVDLVHRELRGLEALIEAHARERRRARRGPARFRHDRAAALAASVSRPLLQLHAARAAASQSAHDDEPPLAQRHVRHRGLVVGLDRPRDFRRESRIARRRSTSSAGWRGRARGSGRISPASSLGASCSRRPAPATASWHPLGILGRDVSRVHGAVRDGRDVSCASTCAGSSRVSRCCSSSPGPPGSSATSCT